ncbi:MAG: type II toxin-antitoxin system RelE/ParE family toxin [Euryarchaeota archaeon]|nr:type II toxin-antitoxin system RelE/ParE family toxin [Euryarchaeota archaeon]MBU4339343.1 type II toxin-antitoxin system RelE/ParE family toxin [Euryarchaeota archaeon]MBU4454876.1 type II toxin-antitoxin system RelE/ParE family toxin [Euryarchaeota archaeon]MCG2738283.1 type II toxin-antitoxin system RelE/ParE family toxin [Candidatus Methanoperedenaceae archaeon]
MRYSYEVSKRLERELDKLQKKNKKRFEIILKKMSEILDDPHHYKPLQYEMKGLRRVHIDKSFVLVFEIIEAEKKVIFIDFDHHDNIY